MEIKSKQGDLYLDKTDFKSTTIKKRKRWSLYDKEIIQQDVIILNIYAPNSRAPRIIKQLLVDLRKEMNSNTIIEFNH